MSKIKAGEDILLYLHRGTANLYVAFSLLLNALFMIISSGVSVIYADSAFMRLLYSGLVTALFGIFPLIFISPAPNISNKESHLIVVCSWLLSCIVSMLPYIIWGEPFNLTNAWFESVSGFTNTGSSILTDVEILPHGLLALLEAILLIICVMNVFDAITHAYQ
jgi:trk system potassium uptake protein TrkH